jgi:hypothetical protein
LPLNVIARQLDEAEPGFAAGDVGMGVAHGGRVAKLHRAWLAVDEKLERQDLAREAGAKRRRGCAPAGASSTSRPA